MRETCLTLTRKTPERRQWHLWRRSGVFIAIFEQIWISQNFFAMKPITVVFMKYVWRQNRKNKFQNKLLIEMSAHDNGSPSVAHR